MNSVFEKIIEKLEEEKMSYFLTIANTGDEKLDCTYEQVGNALDKAIEIVKQEAEQYNNGWIPCSGRLPTTEEYQRGNGRFLVTDGNRTYEAEFDIYESHTVGKSRMAIDWFITDKCVTHWQNEPLPPQPYQPKGE